MSTTRHKITQLDIIKEVGSICAGNSSRAFSQMVKNPLVLESPHIFHIPLISLEEKLELREKIVVGVRCQILTGIEGYVSLIFEEKSAYAFSGLLNLPTQKESGFLTALGISSIKELGNVVVSAYSNAMSVLLQCSVIPSIPMFISGQLIDVLQLSIKPFEVSESIYVHTMVFHDSARRIQGTFYLVLSPDTGKQVCDSMRRQLRTLSAAQKTLQRLRDEKSA